MATPRREINKRTKVSIAIPLGRILEIQYPAGHDGCHKRPGTGSQLLLIGRTSRETGSDTILPNTYSAKCLSLAADEWWWS